MHMLFVHHSFKVQVRVQDGSGTTSFVMFDRDVTKLLHKHAFEIREKQVSITMIEKLSLLQIFYVANYYSIRLYKLDSEWRFRHFS